MSSVFEKIVSEIESFIVPPKKGDSFRLDRIAQLLTIMGNPQNSYPIIHVGGTSGKGSTSYLIAHILKECGYRVGLHMSPHLVSLTERLIINGTPISEDRFVELFKSMKDSIAQVSRSNPLGAPSYFEILVGMTLQYFKQERVDVAVIEVGMGGRFDATNVISSAVSVFTNVGLDHTEFLGDTVEKIAMEKREIIKQHSKTVSAVMQESVRELVIKKCNEVGSDLALINRDFTVSDIRVNPNGFADGGIQFTYESKDLLMKDISLGLSGPFQAINAAVAITACRNLSGFSGTHQQIRYALFHAVFPGRLETVSIDSHRILLDGAHNPMKMAALVDSLAKSYPGKKFPVLFALKNDKNLPEIVQMLLPHTQKFILTSFERTTDMGKSVMYPMEQLKQGIRSVSSTIPIETQSDLPSTIRTYTTESDTTNTLLVTGSLYLVGETRKILSLPWISQT